MSHHRRVAESGFTLPPNPSYIDFPRTDGNASTWPANTTRIVDHEGHVNFYEHVDLDHMQNMRWRTLVGDAVSLKLKMPEGPNYVLKNFPDGYRLYDHNKGPEKAPRHDLYLFGPLKKRFRSVNEFIPHAIWLMGDTGNDCECKYCAKKSQRDITASMSNILRVTPTQSPAPQKIKPNREKGKGRDPMTRLKEARQRDTRVYAAVQKTVKPLKASVTVLKQPMLVERSNDLRALYSKTSMHIRRWFREGEVVWCSLEHPISAPGVHGDIVTIEYWPAVVDEVKLKTDPIPREIPNGKSPMQHDNQQASSSAMQVDLEPTEGDRGPMLEPSGDPLPWTIRQSTRYKVHFLAVSHSMTIDDDQVLPYQACMPSNELIDLMVTHPPDQLKFDKESISKFNPCCGTPPPTLFEAVPAYALAIQIASSISSFWCFTDDYAFKYSIPQTPPVSPSKDRPYPHSQSISSASQFTSSSSSQMPPPPTTLQEAIEAAGRHNLQISNSSYYNNAAASHPSMSPAETHDTASRILGSPPDQLTQTRFQGLWWGSERIWVDDFIRLKIPRRTLAPNGDNHILPASGPGQKLKADWKSSGRDAKDLGAGMRGIFLRLDGLITVDVNVDGKITKEARVCGMLYELAEEDWEGFDLSEVPSENGTEGEDVVMASDGPSRPLAGSSTVQSSLQKGSASQNGISPKRTNGLISTDTTTSGPPAENILPQPPLGYKFRPIIEPGYEFVGAMGLISGRYYPNILQHPRMKPRVQAALQDMNTDRDSSSNVWALEGLSGGYFNSVDPHRYKKSRVQMMQDADTDAVTQLESYAQQRMAELETSGNDSMDIDDIYV